MIDLSLLTPPDVVETLDYEVILAERTAYLVSLYPESEQATVTEQLKLESDPRTKLLQENAYREVMLRQRINDAARAVLLASSTGEDLTHLAALFGVERRVADPGAPDAVPPVAPTYETDASLRTRTQLAPESYTSCGTFAAYRYQALAVTGVADAVVLRPEPGIVRIVVLGGEGDGSPSVALLETVQAHLAADDLRSVNDAVEVVGAEILGYVVSARLTLYPGPAAAPVLEQARAAVQAYAEQTHRLGYDVTLSGLYAALHRSGVQRVALEAPLVDILCSDSQAPRLLDLQIALAEATDV
ncbi:baseplate assembly protein [Azotobacter vinelandii]